MGEIGIAMAASSVAVVGVILNLAVWFALHVFFDKVGSLEAGPLRLWVPEPATLNWRVVVLAAISAVLLLWRHWRILSVLAASAFLSLAIRALAI